MKSAARLALILACLGIGLSFSQYFVQYLPRLGLGGQNTMMFVYLIIAPLSILPAQPACHHPGVCYYEI